MYSGILKLTKITVAILSSTLHQQTSNYAKAVNGKIKSGVKTN